METYKTYAEKLKDPRWQKKRLEIFERDKWACQECTSKTDTLHVHHKRYDKGKDPWDYDDYNFVTMCEGCHALEESFKENQVLRNYADSMDLTRIGLWRIIGAIAYLDSINRKSCDDLIDDLFSKAIRPDRKAFSEFLIQTFNGTNA